MRAREPWCTHRRVALHCIHCTGKLLPAYPLAAYKTRQPHTFSLYCLFAHLVFYYTIMFSYKLHHNSHIFPACGEFWYSEPPVNNGSLCTSVTMVRTFVWFGTLFCRMSSLQTEHARDLICTFSLLKDQSIGFFSLEISVS